MKKTLVTGGTGMIGVALQKKLDAIYISSSDYDLRDPKQCSEMYKRYKPDQVVHLAAKVGGIKANKDGLADFYYDNIMINTNVLHYAKENNVEKVLSMLSTCIYPDNAAYPLTEENIHDGEPHESNFAYAHVKRMLDVQSRAYRKQYGCNFITASPNNLFGENDNFDLDNSHVLPAIIRKVYEAKMNNGIVELWGDGSPLREFTYSGDLADIIVFLLENYNGDRPINIGTTEEYSIKQAAELICKIFGFTGDIHWQKSHYKGQYRKPSNISKLLDLGWKKENFSDFEESLIKVCGWFENNYPNLRGINI